MKRLVTNLFILTTIACAILYVVEHRKVLKEQGNVADMVMKLTEYENTVGEARAVIKSNEAVRALLEAELGGATQMIGQLQAQVSMLGSFTGRVVELEEKLKAQSEPPAAAEPTNAVPADPE